MIVVAGMGRALASVVGGLVDRPVIPVPTSAGFGVSLAGVTPRSLRWQIGVGARNVHPIWVLDATDTDAEISRGCPRYLSIECRQMPGELTVDGRATCDRMARAMMIRIGSALGVRCVLWRDVQGVLGEHPLPPDSREPRTSG